MLLRLDPGWEWLFYVDFAQQSKNRTAAFFLKYGFVREVEYVTGGEKFTITKAERQLIEVIRSLDYGEVRVMIKDKRPVRVEEIRRRIQLSADK